MTTLRRVAIEDLKGRRIKEVKFGHPDKRERYDGGRVVRNSYGVLTITTDEGTFVLSCTMLASEISTWKEEKGETI